MATQGSKQFTAFAFLLNDGWYRFQIADSTGSFFCDFENAKSLSGQRLVKGKVFRSEKGSDKSTDLKKGCTATLAASGTASTGSASTGSASGSSNALSWPIKAAPGQVWTVQIDGLTPWKVSFENLDQDGDPTGPATQGSKKFVAFAITYKDGWFGFQIVDTTGAYSCDFEDASSISGMRLTKGQAFRQEKGAEKPQSLNKSCSATLVSGSVSGVPQAGTEMDNPIRSFSSLYELVARVRP